MQKFLFIKTLLLVLLIFGVVCQGATPSSYWQRLEGFPNQLTVYVLSQEYHTPHIEIHLEIPQLHGFVDVNWQEELNSSLIIEATAFAQEMIANATQVLAEYGAENFRPYVGYLTPEVRLNRGGILSLTLTYYAYTGGAHGMTEIDYINLDLTTGSKLKLTDFLPTDEELFRAAMVIDAAIKEEPEWFFGTEFAPDLFEDEQDFYLSDGQLVICFGHYVLAPYSSGIQEFSVSVP